MMKKFQSPWPMTFWSNQASEARVEMQYLCSIYGPSLVILTLTFSEKRR